MQRAKLFGIHCPLLGGILISVTPLGAPVLAQNEPHHDPYGYGGYFSQDYLSDDYFSDDYFDESYFDSEADTSNASSERYYTDDWYSDDADFDGWYRRRGH